VVVADVLVVLVEAFAADVSVALDWVVVDFTVEVAVVVEAFLVVVVVVVALAVVVVTFLVVVVTFLVVVVVGLAVVVVGAPQWQPGFHA
jgi:hypothetical protein